MGENFRYLHIFYPMHTCVHTQSHIYIPSWYIFTVFTLIIWGFSLLVLHAANYSSASQHEQKNKNTTGPLKLSAVTIKQ